jgi:hypothetical protein
MHNGITAPGTSQSLVNEQLSDCPHCNETVLNSSSITIWVSGKLFVLGLV